MSAGDPSVDDTSVDDISVDYISVGYLTYLWKVSVPLSMALPRTAFLVFSWNRCSHLKKTGMRGV